MRIPKTGVAFPSILLLGMCLLPVHGTANEPRDTGKHEKDRIRAEESRRRSIFNSRVDMEYPNVYQYPADRTIDYRALSDQIHRLSELLRKLEQEEGGTEDSEKSFIPTAPPRVLDSVPPGGYKDQLAYIYGPDGPTVRSVRILLEYHLLVMGNPRLKIGDISDEAHHIRARVVTTENSLVEEYLIDKKTGGWKQVR